MDLPALEGSLVVKIRALGECQEEAELRKAAESVSKLVCRYEECLEESALDPANNNMVTFHRKRISQLLESFQQTQSQVRKTIRLRLANMEMGELLRHRVRQAAAEKTEAELAGEIGGTLDRLGQRLAEEIEKSSHNYALMDDSSKRLDQTHQRYQQFGGILGASRQLINDLWRREKRDQLYLLISLVFLAGVILYIVLSRIWLAPITVPVRLVYSIGKRVFGVVKGGPKNVQHQVATSKDLDHSFYHPTSQAQVEFQEPNEKVEKVAQRKKEPEVAPAQTQQMPVDEPPIEEIEGVGQADSAKMDTVKEPVDAPAQAAEVKEQSDKPLEEVAQAKEEIANEAEDAPPKDTASNLAAEKFTSPSTGKTYWTRGSRDWSQRRLLKRFGQDEIFLEGTEERPGAEELSQILYEWLLSIDDGEDDDDKDEL